MNFTIDNPQNQDSWSLGAPYSLALKQSFFLTLFTLFCIHKTFGWGLGLCAPTFEEGALRFVHGISPYLSPLNPLADRFQYPPFFAWMYYPFTQMTPIVHGVAWMTLNTFIFWLGVSRWLALRPSDRRNFKWNLLFFALCAMEMEMAIRFRQNNAIHTGCILLGVREYVDRRDWRAAAWLLFGTGIKVLPIVFAFLLLFPIRPRFWLACIVMGLTIVLAPSLTAGTWGIKMFSNWVNHMFIVVIPTQGQQDIASVAERIGIQKIIAVALQRGIFVLTAAVLLLTRFFSKKEFPWDLWIPLVFMAILLCSPKTEAPSFVMFAPFCVFYGIYLRRTWGKGNYFALMGYVFSILLVSGVHNDLFFLKYFWPISFSMETKPYGTVVAWLALMIPLTKQLSSTVLQTMKSRLEALTSPASTAT